MKKFLLAMIMLAACAPEPGGQGEDSSSDAQVIRTWDEWVKESRFVPDEHQRVMLERGDVLIGVVPSKDLPIKHPNGTIEVTQATYAKIQNGLAYSNIEAWAAEGLYDPTSNEQRKLFERRFGIMPVDGYSEATAALDGSGSSEPPPPYKCNIRLAMVATFTPIPATPTDASTTTNCDDYFGEYAHKWTGAGYKKTLALPGSPERWGTCEETASNGDASSGKVEGLLKEIGRDAIAPGICPDTYKSNVTVMGRANTYIEGNATVNFQNISFWDVGIGTYSFGAKSSSEVKADALDKVVIAAGEAELASDCTSSGGVEVGGKVSAKAVEGTATLKVGRVCKDFPFYYNTLGICVEADSRQQQVFQVPAGGASVTFKSLVDVRQTESKAKSAKAATGTLGGLLALYQVDASAKMETKRSCAQLMPTMCGVSDIPTDRPNAGVTCGVTEVQGPSWASYGDCSTIF